MLDTGPIIKFHNQKEDFSAYPEASFAARALAFFIDALIIGIAQSAFAAAIDFAVRSLHVPIHLYSWLNVAFILGNFVLIPSLYFIPQMTRGGQTVGKKVMAIKVIQEDNTEKLSSQRVFLREIIGKFVSAAFFGAGYMVRFFGLDAFHDKIAKTKVISLKVRQ